MFRKFLMLEKEVTAAYIMEMISDVTKQIKMTHAVLE